MQDVCQPDLQDEASSALVCWGSALCQLFTSCISFIHQMDVSTSDWSEVCQILYVPPFQVELVMLEDEVRYPHNHS